ncbi:DNA polymerase III subunit delta' [Sporolituus thermophilus]|uniref:DNA polymerase III subunit delta' n=1 Tax=Sporolituus thermophilus DSM 23256 TaxID=1123285 RepID=A0A1G7HMF4_9FIRM|nr:DNA polymerase III subunit delta' [Sporolituus thermophilus]SDF01645.1 DNA polymerase-3 subunit delta' [Sporolituus thermophilus DSM 23256]
MFWDEIVGHAETIKMLQGMLRSGRLPHALLFAGPEGVGKTLVAKALAASLLCQGAVRPCGGCPACRQTAEFAHPALKVIVPAGNTIKIDQIRELQHEAALAGGDGWRLCVIEQAERMTAQAANSLLKLLEEPPPRLIFILLTASPHALIDTIRSRCQVLRFAPLPPEVLTAALTRRGYGEEAARVAARLSGGRMGTALALLTPGGMALRDQAAAMLAKLPAADMETVWSAAATLDKLAPADFTAFLHYLTCLLRDLLLLAEGHRPDLLFNLDLTHELAGLARAWTPPALFAALAAVRDAGRAVQGNANIRLTCEALFIHLVDLAKEGSDAIHGSRRAL